MGHTASYSTTQSAELQEIVKIVATDIAIGIFLTAVIAGPYYWFT